jgi:hypothetical protein
MTFFKQPTLSNIRATYTRLYEPEYVRSFTEIYWYSLLASSLVIAIVASVYGATTFLGVVALLDASGPGSTASPHITSPLDQSLLDATLGGFELRRSHLAAMQVEHIVPIADPSR